MGKAKLWFFRFTAVHFILTGLTGVALYFRPGENRPGWYSEQVKEILVMVHNGEWLSALLLGRPVWSGLAIGLCLSATLLWFSYRRLVRRNAENG